MKLFKTCLLLAGLLLCLQGCFATYEHTVVGSLDDGQFTETYKVDVQTDDFILEQSSTND